MVTGPPMNRFCGFCAATEPVSASSIIAVTMRRRFIKHLAWGQTPNPWHIAGGGSDREKRTDSGSDPRTGTISGWRRHSADVQTAVGAFGAPDYMTDNRLLDGRVIKDRILDAVAVRVSAAVATHPVGRLVSIIIGDNKEAAVYVRAQANAAKRVGLRFEDARWPS